MPTRHDHDAGGDADRIAQQTRERLIQLVRREHDNQYEQRKRARQDEEGEGEDHEDYDSLDEIEDDDEEDEPGTSCLLWMCCT